MLKISFKTRALELRRRALWMRMRWLTAYFRSSAEMKLPWASLTNSPKKLALTRMIELLKGEGKEDTHATSLA